MLVTYLILYYIVEISVREEVEAQGNIKRATFVTEGFLANGNVVCKDTVKSSCILCSNLVWFDFSNTNPLFFFQLDDDIDIAMVGEITLSFRLEFMNMFAKAYKLSNTVSIGLIDDAHNNGDMLEYKLGNGHLRFYLASLL